MGNIISLPVDQRGSCISVWKGEMHLGKEVDFNFKLYRSYCKLNGQELLKYKKYTLVKSFDNSLCIPFTQNLSLLSLVHSSRRFSVMFKASCRYSATSTVSVIDSQASIPAQPLQKLSTVQGRMLYPSVLPTSPSPLHSSQWHWGLHGLCSAPFCSNSLLTYFQCIMSCQSDSRPVTLVHHRYQTLTDIPA